MPCPPVLRDRKNQASSFTCSALLVSTNFFLLYSSLTISYLNIPLHFFLNTSINRLALMGKAQRRKYIFCSFSDKTWQNFGDPRSQFKMTNVCQNSLSLQSRIYYFFQRYRASIWQQHMRKSIHVLRRNSNYV